MKTIQASEVKIEVGPVAVLGDLTVPENAKGIVLFAHGSGSGRLHLCHAVLSDQSRARRRALLRGGIGRLFGGVDYVSHAVETGPGVRAGIRRSTQSSQ